MFEVQCHTNYVRVEKKTGLNMYKMPVPNLDVLNASGTLTMGTAPE